MNGEAGNGIMKYDVEGDSVIRCAKNEIALSIARFLPIEGTAYREEATERDDIGI